MDIIKIEVLLSILSNYILKYFASSLISSLLLGFGFICKYIIHNMLYYVQITKFDKCKICFNKFSTK